MKKWLVRALMVILGASIGISFFPNVWELTPLAQYPIMQLALVNGVIGALLFFGISFFIEKYIIQWIERLEHSVRKKSLLTLLSNGLGVIIGLGIGALVSLPLYKMDVIFVNNILPAFIMLLFGYFGYYILKTRGEELGRLLHHKSRHEDMTKTDANISVHAYKILDTSVIIDGRIYDIAKTGFIEGTILIPNFVLYELQYIADSADNLKRVRGRRGLDILNALQKEPGIDVQMYDGDFDDIEEVDTKLIHLAKLLNGVIVTNDYNLNKVSEFQNVQVLNINALANAVKPVVVPGEEMTVTIVKAGTEREQGVAYLDDGTMIVVEDGMKHMNETIDVYVTSTIQTAAGRMIFAKLLQSSKNG